MSIRTYTKERIDELLASAIDAAKGASAPLTHGSRHRAGGEDPIPPTILPGSGAGADLNALLAQGVYFQGSSANTTTALGYPFVNFAGLVEVFNNNNAMIVQRAVYFYPGNATSDGVWVRVKYAANAWGAWKRSGDSLPSQIIGSSAFSQSLMTIPSRDHMRAELGGSPLVIQNTDLDTMRTAGLYYIYQGNTNIPPAQTSNAYLEVITYPGTYAMQRWTSFNVSKPEVWVRLLAGGWGAWTPVSAPGHRDQYGTGGSPLGRVVPELKGVRYVDRDATNGARQWYATSTSASSWVVCDGDTGWRTISSWTSAGVVTGAALPAGMTAVAGQAGSIRFRRENQEVTLDIRGAVWTAPAQVPIPAGFVPTAGEYPVIPVACGDGTTATASVGASAVFAPSLKSAMPAGFGFTARWRTSTAWPTALPGT